MPGTTIEELKRAQVSGRRLVWVEGEDEERLGEDLDRVWPGERARWTPLSETSLRQALGAPATPGEGLPRRFPPGGVLILGAGDLLHEKAEPRWALREAALGLEGGATTGALVVLALQGPPADLLDVCARVVQTPPTREELRLLVESVLGASVSGTQPSASDSATESDSPARPRAEVLADALAGLGRRDALSALRVARAAGSSSDGSGEVLAAALAEKARRLGRGVIEFVPPATDLRDLGGLSELKTWLERRRALFSREALEAGLPVPRGILLMGVSGCGKSTAAKATSRLWGVPLFRLDLNLVFSGLYGSPEAAFHAALAKVERAAPAVLWIDELENGISSASQGTSQNHLFSAFLTWMQEKPPLVFVAATANRVDLLPAEVLRKGRFDEVFFCDLPSDASRRDLFQIHLRRAGLDPADFNLDFLVTDTESWTGAEIEQVVAAGRVDALAEGVAVTTDHVSAASDRVVPLSKTMHEQIRALREWSRHRATPADRS